MTHLVRLVLDRRRAMRLPGARRAGVDEGYLLHAVLSHLFAESEDQRPSIPLRPFVLDDTYAKQQGRPDQIYVLGYADCDERGIRDAMNPDRSDLVRQCVSRAMPSFEAGQRVRFRVKTCPVVRTKHPGLDGQRPAKSREVDAWLVHRFKNWQPEPPLRDGLPFEREGAEWIEREQIYGQWLSRELARGGASKLEEVSMAEFQRATFHRRTKRTERPPPRRPVVQLEGELIVEDADAFSALVKRGVGRHRAFGMGMLLLRAT